MLLRLSPLSFCTDVVGEKKLFRLKAGISCGHGLFSPRETGFLSVFQRSTRFNLNGFFYSLPRFKDDVKKKKKKKKKKTYVVWIIVHHLTSLCVFKYILIGFPSEISLLFNIVCCVCTLKLHSPSIFVIPMCSNN